MMGYSCEGMKQRIVDFFWEMENRISWSPKKGQGRYEAIRWWQKGEPRVEKSAFGHLV